MVILHHRLVKQSRDYVKKVDAYTLQFDAGQFKMYSLYLQKLVDSVCPASVYSVA